MQSCLQFPRLEEDWVRIAKDFERKWDFPNCLGAIDGKHVQIIPPKNCGSYYYNYKGSHSIVLMAVVDANYKFIYVDVGRNGRVSDGGVWDGCSLNKLLLRSAAGIPEKRSPSNSNRELPYVFVADDAFPLRTHMLKPFPFRHQTVQQRIFSYRLSRARRVVENAFGILANKFRVLLTPIYLEPSKVELIVLACTSLHNFIRDNSEMKESVDHEDILTGDIIAGSWRSEESLIPLLRRPRKVPEAAKSVREEYCRYFNEEGAIPWQRKMIGLPDD